MKIGTFAFVSALACALTLKAVAQEYYPEPALSACAAGIVTIHCTMAADGRLADCKILSETPLGEGFGVATLTVSRLWKIRQRAGQAFQRRVIWLPPSDCGAVWLNHLAQGAFYPANALRANVEATTTAQCDVGADGGLRNCRILSEKPLGYGFGEATVRMYETGLRMTMTPEIARGGTVVTRTVFWKPPPNPTPAPANPPPSAP